MSSNLVFAAFSPSDKVPGFYGGIQYGVSGQTAAGLPLALLLVGLMTTGTLQPDSQVQQIFQSADADTYAGPGSELATMAYDAFKNAPNTPIYITSAKPASGGVASTATIALGGTWNVAGSLTVRIAGTAIPLTVGAADTPSTVATNLALAINGTLSGRLPISTTASGATVVITCRTPGVRGNQHIVFLDASLQPSGMTASIVGSTWAATTAYTTTQFVVPTVANGFYYKCTTGGTSGSSQPTFPTTVGTTVTDGSVTWTCWGTIVAQNTTTGITLGGGVGLETYTNLINTLTNAKYARHAFAANDASSASTWEGSIDSQALITSGIRQHVVVAINTTLAGAESLGQTTLNDPRFQCLFLQNSETHPARMAAGVAGARALKEVSDPNASYDGAVIPTIMPQSQTTDIPLHSQLVALLNNSVTPLTTQGGQVQIVRSITTKSLTNSAPDYSTLDTGMATTPDFVLDQLSIVWSSSYANPVTGNTRVEPDPLQNSGETTPPPGVAYPRTWTATVQGQLQAMELGRFPGTCPPILYNVENDPPSTTFDAVNKRLLTIVPCWPTPALHQGLVALNQAS
ncbi:MAG TPA: hypothetical protein VK841_09385 [Polyangiaceae bacterium]|jgi:phage tail sheath gpL-like|nr:hypothetical protein [Polyangiaceae bacterium]